ncbi:MAG: thioredoxin [Chloroflexi bacterium]|nr:thioredoxin [Chloroflexota bacterium]MQC26206.1 thioredoxin [Chloroflexota bacterium]
MGQLYEVNKDTFENDVLKASKPVLIEFGAVWCAPCKVLEPIMEELAAEWGDDILVAKIDVDDAVDIAGGYQIFSVPTTILFKDGEPLERFVGVQPKHRMNDKVQEHLQATKAD